MKHLFFIRALNLVLFVVFSLSVMICKGQFCCKAKLELPAKDSTSNKMILAIKLISRCRNTFIIPNRKNLVVGSKNDKGANCYFEIFELKDSSTIEIFPTSDYQYFNKQTQFRKLKKGQSFIYYFNLEDFYTLNDEKTYKIRVIFKVFYNNYLEDCVSEWVMY